MTDTSPTHGPAHGSVHERAREPSRTSTAAPSAPTPRRTRLGSAGVACVLAIAGLLFTSNASLARSTQERDPQNLSELVRSESARVEDLAAEVDTLRLEVDDLTDAAAAPGAPPDSDPLADIASGRVAVSGPGIVVALDDAPRGTTRPGFRPDDLVVHQQDLQAVINALWAGGAEAMTLQGQRVVATSAFRCVGNVLLLHGRTYSPPYVVEAIGDPERLERSLLRSPAVQIYLDYVEAVGLGWSMTTEQNLLLPAFEGGLSLEHAAVPAAVQLTSGAVVASE